MSFLKKVELKKQLRDMGIKVEGNYVRKKDIESVVAEWNARENRRDARGRAVRVCHTDAACLRA